MSQPIKFGTRGSALALAQVRLVEAAMQAAGDDRAIEYTTIVTSGDRRTDFTDAYASGAGVKGLFTKELERALLDGSIDVAVHSCKDLPGNTALGLGVCAVLARADTSDVLLGRFGFSELPSESVIGTGSVRRRRQILELRPDLIVREVRGNVPTRIEKMASSDSLNGIVLARAGLDRLGIELGGWRIEALPILPAIGQGAIALQCRSDDVAVIGALARINHVPTFTCIRAERELLRLLDGDCRMPVGVSSRLDSGTLFLEAILFLEGGGPPRKACACGAADQPEIIAAELFRGLRS